jgi:hypothetical protein
VLCITFGHLHITFEKKGEQSTGKLLLKFCHRMIHPFLEIYITERTLFWGRW